MINNKCHSALDAESRNLLIATGFSIKLRMTETENLI